MCFDRALHFDGLNSPLAEDPEGYLADWHASAVVRRLGAPRLPSRHDRSSGVGGQTIEGERRTRVLVTTRKNANFLGEIREYLDQDPAIEQRFLDLAAFPRLNRFAGDLARTAAQILGDRPELRGILERRVQPHLDWADVVFVEWCLHQAVFVTMLDPRDTRVVVRLHSQELFTVWPHLVDFSRVDDVVFVSEHLRELAIVVIPALTGPNAPALHVIPNALKLQRFVRPKPAEARFNLGLIGWGHVAKDALWALDVIRALRARDERYTLHLYGADFRRDFGAAAQEYGDRLMPVLEDLERQGAVQRHGHSDDVPGVLENIGVVLSSSVRESFHAAVVEGAASGAVPVVRDWPFFAGRPHGARTLFPVDWVVDTPEQATERVLATTADEDTWRRLGAEASGHALAEFDWEVVKHRFDSLFLPRGA
ncbi:hypothetical protein GCM10027273_17230 [Nocardioides pakistanensis]